MAGWIALEHSMASIPEPTTVMNLTSKGMSEGYFLWFR